MFYTLIAVYFLLLFSIICGATTILFWCCWRKPLSSNTMTLHLIIQAALTAALGFPTMVMRLVKDITMRDRTVTSVLCDTNDRACMDIVGRLVHYECVLDITFYILLISSVLLGLRIFINLIHHACCCKHCGGMCCGGSCDAQKDAETTEKTESEKE